MSFYSAMILLRRHASCLILCFRTTAVTSAFSSLTDGSFLRRHSEAQLLGGVGLGLLPQQGAQGAPEDEGDAAPGHRGVARRLGGPAVGRQLHQQRQEGREVGLQPGASQGGDEDHAGLRKRRRQ